MAVEDRDDDDGDAAKAPSNDQESRTQAELQAELQAANGFIREVAGRMALELATTPEGRAAGLSVEVWPERGVSLRVRTGHELRVLVERREDVVWVLWERIDPAPRGGRPRARHGSLGKLRLMGVDDLQAFSRKWLAWRARG
jgi:hypothetical protein